MLRHSPPSSPQGPAPVWPLRRAARSCSGSHDARGRRCQRCAVPPGMQARSMRRRPPTRARALWHDALGARRSAEHHRAHAPRPPNGGMGGARARFLFLGVTLFLTNCHVAARHTGTQQSNLMDSLLAWLPCIGKHARTLSLHPPLVGQAPERAVKARWHL